MASFPKLTKTIIEQHLKMQKELSGKAQLFVWDERLPGFGLKISQKKAMYIIDKRVSGKKVRFILGAYAEFGTPDEAKEQAAEQLKLMKDGYNPNIDKKLKFGKGSTLAEVLHDYLVTYDSKLRPKTKKIYREAIERCFNDWLNIPLLQIDEQMVSEKQIEQSNLTNRKGKGEAQANQAMRVLRTLFNYAIETYKDSAKQPIFTLNPVRALKARRLWNKPRTRNDIIEDDDLAVWYECLMKVQNKTARDYILLCLFTGLRRGEASKLTWENVLRLNGKRPALRIPEEDSKTGAIHEIPLSDFVVNLLNSRPRAINKGYVFPGERAGTNFRSPKRAIAQVVETSGVKFSMHTLRRTFSTVAGKLDIAHYKHKMLMNHSMNAEITGAHYVRLSTEDLREPAQKISDHLVKHCKIEFEPLTASS